MVETKFDILLLFGKFVKWSTTYGNEGLLESKKWHELQAVTSLSQKRDRMEGSNLKLKVIAISHSKRGRIKKI